LKDYVANALSPENPAGRRRSCAVRSSLAFSLELEGFLIETFECGEDPAAKAELPEYCCLVLDYRLLGMGGLTLLKALRRLGVKFPAVLISPFGCPGT
jgi:FixJ family two-component response regulator